MSSLFVASLTLAFGALGKDCKRHEMISFDDGNGDCSSPSSSFLHPSPTSTSPALPSGSSSYTSTSMSSTSATPPFDSPHNPTDDPSLNAPLPPTHHPFETATVIALILGIILVVLLLVGIGLMLLRRYRHRRANRQVKRSLEQGGSTLPVATKTTDAVVGEKWPIAIVTPPASSFGSESRTSSLTSRMRRAVRGIITSGSTASSQCGSNSGPNMSEARQGVLVSVPRVSQTPSSPSLLADLTQSPSSPSLLADLTQPPHAMTENRSRLVSIGGSVLIARPGTVVIREDWIPPNIDEAYKRNLPPAYDSLI